MKGDDAMNLTTMIYTRVLNKGGHGVKSPVDMFVTGLDAERSLYKAAKPFKPDRPVQGPRRRLEVRRSLDEPTPF